MKNFEQIYQQVLNDSYDERDPLTGVPSRKNPNRHEAEYTKAELYGNQKLCILFDGFDSFCCDDPLSRKAFLMTMKEANEFQALKTNLEKRNFLMKIARKGRSYYIRKESLR